MSKPPPPPPPVTPVEDLDEARTSFAALVDRVEATIERASSFSDEERNRRVNDEWSTIESIRHLVFVVDVWLSRTMRGEEDPFHPIGLPPSFVPAEKVPGSIDPDARPSFDEATTALRDRISILGDYVDGLSPDELARPIPAHAETAGGGLSVIFTEFEAHDHFTNRDLDKIQSSR